MLKGWGLLIVLAVALAAAMLVLPDQATAQSPQCRSGGIVPGSVSITSTNSGAGQVSGHTARFQLCQAPLSQSSAGGSKQPDKIGLLWSKWSQNEFVLNNPGAAGITLSEVGSSQVWQANSDLSESTDPDPRGHVYSTSNSYHHYHNPQGVTVEFTPAYRSGRSDASADLPLTLQFNVPVSAGMSNPKRSGDYSWLIVLFHDIANSCEAKFASATPPISIVAPFLSGELQLSKKYGNPGSKITVKGNGFPPSAPVQIVRIGPFIIDPDSDRWSSWLPQDVTTNASGSFEFDFIVPGLDVGSQPIKVQVAGKTVSAAFTVTWSPGSGPDWSLAKEGLTNLGDNFVRSFHYDEFNRRWTFYDPEFPDESDQYFFIHGKRYWKLVKEPAVVILNSTTRNLCCTPEGNCWNQIVW